ncbi:hypothetical protein KVR01_009538 [Diaporthe batatas]|uniref:uncharacterized protein n=1 Tax=Diaporthe batatas TaxID=748121 RepID=UPI001D03981C|nr:uncharacterized protein KVR01_009538 [Diaporthe batatas]KAG8161274.1 hypothetical protein KVR01_009538 [Diaporthe batatas]
MVLYTGPKVQRRPRATTMSSVRILASSPGPQAASPFFSRLPAEIRLMIFRFIFLSCYATAWFDGEWGGDEAAAHQGSRQRRFRSGACCFSHLDGGFEFLATCRQAYIEAFATYWGQVTLDVARSISPDRIGCGLVSVCRYLPSAIKENLGDLGNVKLPVLEVVDSTPDDPTWTPALLSQFPKLRILVVSSLVLFGTTPRARFQLLIDTFGDPSQYYIGVAPFAIEGEGPTYIGVGLFDSEGERPAQYIERKIGVQLSGGLVMLWRCVANQPPDSLPRYRDRVSRGWVRTPQSWKRSQVPSGVVGITDFRLMQLEGQGLRMGREGGCGLV